MKQTHLWRNNSGQNAVEYMLLFAAVVFVMILITARNGLLTRKVQESMDGSINFIKCMPKEICFKEGGCPDLEGCP